MSVVVASNVPNKQSPDFALDMALRVSMEEWKLDHRPIQRSTNGVIRYSATPGEEGYLIVGEIDLASGSVSRADVFYIHNRFFSIPMQSSSGSDVLDLFRSVHEFVSRSVTPDDHITLPAVG